MDSDAADWKEEAFARYVENQKRLEILDRQRLAERGEVALELLASEDDQPPSSEAFQGELSSVTDALRAGEVKYSQTFVALDSAEAVGYAIPEYIVLLKTLGLPAISIIAAGAGAWVQARYGRKVRLKIGDFEGEGRSVEEIEKLLKVAADYPTKRLQSDVKPSGDDVGTLR